MPGRRRRLMGAPISGALFPEALARHPEGAYPRYSYGTGPVMSILSSRRPLIGLDLEYTGDRPEVIGVATEDECAADFWSPDYIGALRSAIESGTVLSMYSGIPADRPVLAGQGLEVPLGSISDGMIRFWLVYAHLCKAPGQRDDGTEDPDEGPLGFMGLWTAASIGTSLPVWKTCRGPACTGPCPRHNGLYYCAVDAWAGLAVDLWARSRMREYGVPESMYVLNARVAELMHGLHRRGVRVDMGRVREIEGAISAKKSRLREGALGGLNPQSPKQVTEFLASKGVFTSKSDKATISSILDEYLEDLGVPRDQVYEGIMSLDPSGAISGLEGPARDLAALLAYKLAGKGTKAWFGRARRDDKGRYLVYPRFSVTGTSTGRLSCSSPNLQNIASRGWGSVLRSAIVPYEDSWTIVEADYSQLELRMMLYLAGRDVSGIGRDAFSWLVSQAEEDFLRASARTGGLVSPRDLAKRTSHAANYLEGLVVVYNTSKYRREIDAGALRLHPECRLGHGVIGFTGANLARSLFGNDSYESRRQALAIQEDIYFRAFPEIRELQWGIIREAYERGYVTIRTGRRLALPRDLTRALKVAAAMHGQGTSADFVKESMLRLVDENPWVRGSILPQVHDSVAFEAPAGMTDREVLKVAGSLFRPSSLLPGFSCPGKVRRGRNYGEMYEVEVKEDE